MATIRQRFASVALAAIITLAHVLTVSADGDGPIITPISEEDRKNLIENGDFSAEPTIESGKPESSATDTWFANADAEKPQTIEWQDGMLVFAGRVKNTQFFYYNTGLTLTPGEYTVSFDIKTAVEGEKSSIRFALTNIYAEKTPVAVNNEWKTVTASVTVEGNMPAQFSLYGGTSASDIHSLCLDNLSIVQTSIIEPEPVDETIPLSISESLPNGNLIENGSFDTADSVGGWNTSTQKLAHVTDENGGYLEFGNLITNYHGFKYSPTKPIPAGKYHFTCYLRMAQPGELTQLRLRFYDVKKNYVLIYAYPVSNQWLKIDSYITLENRLDYFHISGGPSEAFVQEYCMDAMSLVPVDTIPEGGFVESFGEPVNSAQALASNRADTVTYEPYDKNEGYEVQGIIINQDADAFISSCTGATVEKIIDYAKMFRDTHITDYVICLNNTNVTYPSEVWDDLLDKYYQKVENGKPVDYSNNSIMKGAHHVFETLGTDYIALWMDAFREVGINPWISIRMNDAHDIGAETSHLLSDYWHNNPQIRRNQNGSTLRYGGLADYTHKSHRDRVLALVNEALSRYDCYGLELDFQRQIYFWYYGGEYNGIDLMNDFMRDVDAIVAKYEEKYGHEIKITACVAHDIQTNYDFGLDVMTWVEEGILDMVTPKGMNVQQNDIPVEHWRSMLDPYGTVLAPGIDMWVKSDSQAEAVRHDLETYSAAAANILSQGGDKVYLYNFYLTLGSKITDADRVSSKDNSLSILTTKGYHNIVTTIGSYDKLMTMNRRMQVSYSDTSQVWKQVDNQIPKNLMNGKSMTLRIPVGDIPEGAEVTFRLGSTGGTTEDKYPTVKINSVPCELKETVVIAGLATVPLLVYTVPAELHDDMYVTAEVTASEYMSISFADVYIKAPDNAAAPKKANNTPSAWAAAEVDAAIGSGILPWSMRHDYTEKITRSEFCSLIMSMLCKVSGVESSRELLSNLGIDYVDSFTDTNSADVVAANLIGIVNGRGEGIFDPSAGITRQEAAKMLASAAKVLGVTPGTAPEFADIGTASSWAVDSIKETASIVSKSGKNVMGGVGEGNFAPLGAYTKEQSVLTVYRLYDSVADGARVTAGAPVAAVDAGKTTVASPADVKPIGTQGIVIRANADEVNASRLVGTQVTDVILTLGAGDASGVISALRNAGINVYIAGYADASTASVLDKYDVDGIELDFIASGIVNTACGSTYTALAAYSDMIASVNDILEVYEAKYGHDIKLSCRVPAQVMTNYHLGLDITDWAQKGLVDMICPSGNVVADSDMSVRLWHSLLSEYDVSLVPVIGDIIKVKEKDSGLAQTPATLAGYASSMLAKGADKVSVSYSTVDDESLRIIGSYETAMAAEKRVIPTYTDVLTPWQVSDVQLPYSALKGGYALVFIPVGDTAAGQKMILNVAIRGSAAASVEGMEVYANSERCTALGKAASADPLTGHTFYRFESPEKAYNSGHILVELRAAAGMLNIIHVDAEIK